MKTLPDPDAFRLLGGAEKVAAVLLALDREASSRILRHFSQQELRQVAKITATLGTVSCPLIEDICEGLIEEIGANQPGLVGGEAMAEQLLASALPDEQVADIVSDLWGRSNAFIWRRIAELSDKLLSDFLATEHPQTAAVVLARLEPALAARVLASLPPLLRSQAMRRMLVARPTPDAILHVVEAGLQEHLFATSGAPSTSQLSARVAGIVNQLERDQIADIIDGISVSEPHLAEQLKSLIFSFEDIVGLGQRARMIIFDQASTEGVILALRGSSPELREAVLPCLSARTRRMVEAELASPADPPRRDILGAQRDIANLVLRLADQGLIDLSAERAAPAERDQPSGE
jgi:flagellar motor switch protein FliG